jgi:hypothetical protein
MPPTEWERRGFRHGEEVNEGDPVENIEAFRALERSPTVFTGFAG